MSLGVGTSFQVLLRSGLTYSVALFESRSMRELPARLGWNLSLNLKVPIFCGLPLRVESLLLKERPSSSRPPTDTTLMVGNSFLSDTW